MSINDQIEAVSDLSVSVVNPRTREFAKEIAAALNPPVDKWSIRALTDGSLQFVYQEGKTARALIVGAVCVLFFVVMRFGNI